MESRKRMTREQLYEDGISKLNQQEIAEAKLDAWYLFSHVTGLSRVDYMLHKSEPVTEEQEENFEKMIAKRESHYPLQYIIGKQEFMGLEFAVNENVLIPRQDTEVLVEEVLKVSEGKKVLDMCTGSGCIIISLASLSRLSGASAVDISDGALEVAKENSKRNQVEINFIKSNLFENVSDKYDIIVSNPPYIESRVVETLMPEVRLYEPMLALDGREDGLYFYRRIIYQAKEYLNPGGRIFFEIGYDQGYKVKELLTEAGFRDVSVIKDLAGLDRVVRGSLEE